MASKKHFTFCSFLLRMIKLLSCYICTRQQKIALCLFYNYIPAPIDILNYFHWCADSHFHFGASSYFDLLTLVNSHFKNQNLPENSTEQSALPTNWWSNSFQSLQQQVLNNSYDSLKDSNIKQAMNSPLNYNAIVIMLFDKHSIDSLFSVL